VRGIEHVLTGTYCPFSNGQAEGAVRLIKEQFKRTSAAQGEKRLHHAVAVLRLVPGGSKPSPASRLMGWQPVTLLAQLVPRASPVPGGKPRFSPRDIIRFRVKRTVGADTWHLGIILRARGCQIYDVLDVAGTPVRRHQSQLRRAETDGATKKQLLDMADAEQRREEAETGESPEVGGPNVRVQRDSDDVEMSPGVEADLLRSPLAAVEVGTSDDPQPVTSDAGAPDDAPPMDGALGASAATVVTAAAPGSFGEGGAASAQAPRSTAAPPRGAFQGFNPFDRPTASSSRDYTEEEGAVGGVLPQKLRGRRRGQRRRRRRRVGTTQGSYPCTGPPILIMSIYSGVRTHPRVPLGLSVPPGPLSGGSRGAGKAGPGPGRRRANRPSGCGGEGPRRPTVGATWPGPKPIGNVCGHERNRLGKPRLVPPMWRGLRIGGPALLGRRRLATKQ